MMTDRENFLRTVEFRGPRWITCTVGLSPGTWQKYREDLEAVAIRHPLIFGDIRKGSIDFDAMAPTYGKGEKFTDNWGVLWENAHGGIEGIPVGHPLADWDKLDTFTPPDPLVKAERADRPDWESTAQRIHSAKQHGRIFWAGGERFFERLHFLRGYENLMIDFAMDDPHLSRLIDMVIQHNTTLLEKWASLKPDVIWMGDDLGTQSALMVSPAMWRKYLLPGYQKLFKIVRDSGAHCYFHCDGNILEIIDDLIDAGVTILNPQVGANGLDNLVKMCKGRVCVNLDLDRQNILPFGSPQEVRDHVREVVEKFGSPSGGLMIFGECQPNVPLANIEALCQAMEQFQLVS